LKIAKDIYLVGGGDIRISNKADCHVYLIDGGQKKCLIDAGVGIESEKIIDNIKNDGFDPQKDIDFLIITHAHSDHAGGAKYLRDVTGAKVIAPKGEANFIQRGGADLDFGLSVTKKSGTYPKDYKYKHTKVDRIVGHNFRIRVGKYTLRAIQVPGHSHGTTGYLIEQAPRSFFSGDIVFIDGTVGFGNWPGCNLDNYRNYIQRLSELDVGALLPGHFMWTLKEGQSHLDTAIENFKGAWLPPAWTHKHPFY
jgi:hydroxyacylglutathione hydrolase